MKYAEKTLYAAQGLSLPNYPHDLSGRDVSLGLTPAEVDSWKDMEDDWTSVIEASRDFFGTGKKLFYVTNRYSMNAPLKCLTV